MSKQIDAPGLIAFEVTRRCRFNCKHCRANAGPAIEEKELTTVQCKKILTSIAAYCKCTIIMTGGEPMEREDIYELIRFAKDLKLRVVMATCGYLINDESIKKLKKAGVSALSFSLDGASADTHDEFRQTKGAFDITIQAAKMAHKANLPFQINSTISKINVNEVIGIANIAKSLGANCFNPFILVPTGRGAEISAAILDPVQYEMLLNELLRLKMRRSIDVRVTCGPQFARVCQQAKEKKLLDEVGGCMGGKRFAFISYRGDVQICGFLDVPAGNMVQSRFNFKKIWTSSKLLNEVRNVSEYKDKCGICEYVGMCGGCRARAYLMTGDYMGTDEVCDYQPKDKK